MLVHGTFGPSNRFYEVTYDGYCSITIGDYLYVCKCVSSCLTFGEIFCRSTDKDMAEYPNGSANGWIMSMNA